MGKSDYDKDREHHEMLVEFAAADDASGCVGCLSGIVAVVIVAVVIVAVIVIIGLALPSAFGASMGIPASLVAERLAQIG